MLSTHSYKAIRCETVRVVRYLNMKIDVYFSLFKIDGKRLTNVFAKSIHGEDTDNLRCPHRTNHAELTHYYFVFTPKITLGGIHLYRNVYYFFFKKIFNLLIKIVCKYAGINVK